MTKSAHSQAEGDIMAHRASVDETPGRFAGSMSKVIFGAARLTDNSDHHALLDAVYDVGCNVFDTARDYSRGASERCLGSWISSRCLRNQVLIITKGGHPLMGDSRLGQADLMHDLDTSLRTLGVDYVDVFMAHRDDPSRPVEDIVNTFDQMVKQGKVLKCGVSNWSTARVQAALEYAKVSNSQAIGSSSMHFSLAAWNSTPWKGCASLVGESRLQERQWYADSGFPLFAWSSLAAGFFSGRYSSTDLSTGRSYYERVCLETYSSNENWMRLDRCKSLAKEKGCEATQIALAYVLTQHMSIHAIVSSTHRERFRQDMNAMQISLSNAERAWLNLECECLT